MSKEYIYVASPYSHPDPEVRESRFQFVLRVCAVCVELGIPTYSPIVHFHPIDKVLNPTTSRSSDFWIPFWKPMLLNSSLLLILPFNGYNESVGIKEERKVADSANILTITSLSFHEIEKIWGLLNGK